MKSFHVRFLKQVDTVVLVFKKKAEEVKSLQPPNF